MLQSRISIHQIVALNFFNKVPFFEKSNWVKVNSFRAEIACHRSVNVYNRLNHVPIQLCSTATNTSKCSFFRNTEKIMIIIKKKNNGRIRFDVLINDKWSGIAAEREIDQLTQHWHKTDTLTNALYPYRWAHSKISDTWAAVPKSTEIFEYLNEES